MHAGALRALEYDRIVEAVRRFAQTPPGAARLAKLQPLIDARAVASALAATAETTRFLRDGEIALRAPEDLDALLVSLAVEGRVLEPLQLVNLATFLASVDATCAGVRRVRSSFPILAAIAETRRVLPTRDRRYPPQDRSGVRSRRRCEPGAGEPAGSACASSAPGCAERSSRIFAAATRRSICSSRSSPTATAATCSSCAASIAPRFRESCTAARAAAPASSSSRSAPLRSTTTSSSSSSRKSKKCGAFCSHSPMRCASRAGDLQRTVDAATELDVLQARARFSLLVDGIQPAIASDGRLELRAARHPLLIPAVQRHLGADGDRDSGFAARDSGSSDARASEGRVAPFKP